VLKKKLNEKSIGLRKTHWKRLDDNLEELEKNGELARVDPEVKIINYFEDSEGIKLIIHFILALGIFVTGAGCYVFIARNVGINSAVKEGVAVLTNDVNIFGWICLIIFWILVIIYFHRQWQHDIIRTAQSCKYLSTGCQRENNSIETVFNTPNWDNAPQEFKEFVEKTKSQKVVQLEINEA